MFKYGQKRPSEQMELFQRKFLLLIFNLLVIQSFSPSKKV